MTGAATDAAASPAPPAGTAGGPTTALPRVFANSVPKAGTHLLKKALSLFPGLRLAGVHLDINLETDYMRAALDPLPAGAVASGHLVHRPEYVELLASRGFRALLIVRDPRDVVVSFCAYVLKTESHYLHARFEALADDGARLMAALEGIPDPVPWDEQALRPIDQAFEVFRPWFFEPFNRVVRFEGLVGPRGGGSREAQRAELLGIAGHLGLRLEADDLERVARGAYDPASPTFHLGRLGAWRERFSAEHRRAFKRRAGRLLIELGYERDFDW